jgi:hypothetical protein
VTAAKECFLGVGLAMDAGAEALTQAYGVFRTEVQALIPDYSPETVNTDGWVATQTAWQTLFPNITLILCFLHTVLAVQQRCRREPTLFKLVTDKLWHLFHSDTLSQFSHSCYAEFMNMLKLRSLMNLFAKNYWRSKIKRWAFDLVLPSLTLIEPVIKLTV